MMFMKPLSSKAIIVGASSGIGKALAYTLNRHGYTLGLMARRVDAIDQIAKTLCAPSYVKFIDLTDPYPAIQNFNELVHEMGGVDLVIINSGIGFFNQELDWDKEKKTIDVNVSGFTAIADAAMQQFIAEGSGHLVGISSISALRGSDRTPSYNASKAYVSNYLQGLQKKVVREKLNITVTDIKPGFVDTPMTQGSKTFWMAPAAVAAEQIYDAICKHKRHAYITRRWRLIAWLIKLVPDTIYNKFFEV